MRRHSAALFFTLFVAAGALRVPSLAQPAGNDQGLYAYVGQAITRGGVPYRDAWDQKPPAVHLAYAAMYSVWPRDSVVAAVDLVAALVAALLLVSVGRRLSGSRGAGELAALVFLLLGNPSFQRASGMFVRAQCETFIAVLTLGALLAIVVATTERDRGDRLPRPSWLAAAGLLLGTAFLFKYTAAIFAIAAVASVHLLVPAHAVRSRARATVSSALAMAGGWAIPVALVAIWIVQAGAMRDLLEATVRYNVGYSGETYGSAWAFVTYLVSFPVRHAALDSLWLLGGAGCAVLLVAAGSDRRAMLVPLWVAAACGAIAINGGRGLPQYFVQALPLLALAAGLAFMLAWNAFALIPRAVLVVLLLFAVARVSSFDKLANATWRDITYARGGMSTADYLAHFATNRTSAADLRDLAHAMKAKTAEDERVFVFGFSGGAYVRAGRCSASRFFWSRPILVGFNEGKPGYGADGLLQELASSHPAFVVLQQHDWPAEGIDSATYFLRHPKLGAWLRAGYEMTAQNGSYLIWTRRAGV